MTSRQRKYRTKRERAIRLWQRKDFPLQLIAEKIGVGIETVRGWLMKADPELYAGRHGDKRTRPARTPFSGRHQVYLYAEVNSDLYKIGITTRLKQRKYELKSKRKTDDLRLVRATLATKEFEAKLKHIIRDHTEEGSEWFRGKEVAARVAREMSDLNQ